MRSRTLLTQVLAVNTALVALTAFMAALVARDRLKDAASTEGLLLIALAVSGVVLLNSILLRKRLAPIERLVDAMSGVDLSNPGKRADVTRGAADEVRRLSARNGVNVGDPCGPDEEFLDHVRAAVRSLSGAP